MAHHQGMLLSASERALRRRSVARFNRDRRISAIDLLLHERVPWEYIPEPLPDAGTELPEQDAHPIPALHGWSPPEAARSQVHLIAMDGCRPGSRRLAKARFGGSGHSLTRGQPTAAKAVARNRFLRDTSDGDTVSAIARIGGWYVVFHAEGASYHRTRPRHRRDAEITVAASDDLEIRRVTLINQSERERVIEITSYAEPVLAPQAAHERHPAFSKLFLRSEHLAELDGLLFTRRPRRPGDAPPVMLHRGIVEEAAVQVVGVESDRACCWAATDTRGPSPCAILPAPTAGRSIRPRRSACARGSRPGRGSDRVSDDCGRLAGNGARALPVVTAATRRDWAFEDAAAQQPPLMQTVWRHAADRARSQRLAGRILEPSDRQTRLLADQSPGQPDLWGLRLSGDLPIVLLRLSDARPCVLVRPGAGPPTGAAKGFARPRDSGPRHPATTAAAREQSSGLIEAGLNPRG